MNLGRGLARAPMLARQAFKQPSAAKMLASIGPMRAAAKNGRGMGSIGASQISLAFDTTPTVNFNMGPLVLGAFEECFVDNEFKDPTLAALDERLGGMLKKACAENQFTGKPGASCQLRLVAPGAPPLLILRGLGKLEHAASNSWSSFARAAAVELRTGNWEHVGVALATGSEVPPAELTASSASTVKTIGANLQAFATPDNRFKSETKSEDKSKQATAAQTRFHFLGFDDDVQPALDQAAAVARGIRTAVELVNAPANVVTPAALAELAQKLDKEHACMTTQILEKEDCKAYGEHGMGLFLGVAQGSSEAPKFIHISYKPSGPVRRKIALVGKGVTFDSGGLNIKAGAGSMIELMKFDMGGAAAVFGAAVAIADLAPEDVQVDFIVAACENMINGNALKPGDVIKASNGTTVEVDNTDAEGRLTMADALLYAQQLECDEVVDIATLTGACVVALGDDVAGMVTNNDAFGQQVLACSKAAGERVWQLPMERAYRPLLDSYTADILNAGPRAAGAITAALFLDTFVKPEMRWAHIDIAGPVYEIPKGRATGFGVSTLVELALRK